MVFPLDEYPSPFAVNHLFLISVRVISNVQTRGAMKKAAVLSILVVAVLLAIGVTAEAQQPKKVPRIGFLGGASASSYTARIEAFRQGLIELGYAQGKEYRHRIPICGWKG